MREATNACWQFAEAEPSRGDGGAPALVSQERFAAAKGRAGVAWGAHRVALAVAGMRFGFAGLSASQRAGLEATYSPFVAPPTSLADELALATNVRRESAAVLRATRPPGLARHPVVLARDSERLSISGDEFRAEVPLREGEAATIWLANEKALESRIVSENYLRVVTAYLALARGGLLLHCSGFVLDGRARLLLGPSGAGKTTLARKALQAGAIILSDDINVVMPAEGGLRAFSLPFAGELGATACPPETSFPVASLDALEPAAELALSPLDVAQRISTLMAACPFVNSDGERFERLAETAGSVAARWPIRRLRSRIEDPFEAIAHLLARPSDG